MILLNSYFLYYELLLMMEIVGFYMSDHSDHLQMPLLHFTILWMLGNLLY